MKRDRMQAIGVALSVLLQITSAAVLIPAKSEIRVARSTNGNCNKDLVDNFAKSASETCSQIGTVDDYITKVNARQPLPVPSFSDRHGFKKILNDYNSDLSSAKDHGHPWRNGANVVGSLKEMVVAAQEFAPKFNQEFTDNQARIKNLLENHEDIAAIEAKISALEKDIKEAKEAAALAEDTTVVAHLESIIKSKEEEINSTMKEHEVAQARREVAELVTYLELVKSGAAEIESKAETARTKISTFRDSIVRDATSFKRHRSFAQDGVTKLQEEKQNNNDELSSNRESINSLQASINAENAQIASLNGQIQNAERELREIQDRINRNIRREQKKKRFNRWFRFVPVVGWTIGNKFYKDAKRREEELANEKRNFINGHNSQVQNLRNHISRRRQDITTHQERIKTLEAKSVELEQELQHFSQLDGDLQSIESEVNVILPSIASAVSGVGKMKDTFDSIKQSLSETIARATEAKTEAELNNMKYFIYNEIDELRCEWNGASDKIGSVGQCS